MKKLFSVLLALTMAFVLIVPLAACDGKGNGKDAETEYTLTYAANGGEGTVPAAERYKEGAAVTVKPATTFTREGYTFKTWNDGSKDVAAGATFTMPAKNVTLTAQWEEVKPQLYGVWTAEVDAKDFGADESQIAQFTLVTGPGKDVAWTVDAPAATAEAAEGEEEAAKTHDLALVFMQGGEGEDGHLLLGFAMPFDGSEETPGMYTSIPSGPKFQWDEANEKATLFYPTGYNEETKTVEYAQIPLTYLLPQQTAPKFDGSYFTTDGSDSWEELTISGTTLTQKAYRQGTARDPEISRIAGYIGEYAVIASEEESGHEGMYNILRLGENLEYIDGEGPGAIVYRKKTPAKHTITFQYNGTTVGEPVKLTEGCSLGIYMEQAEDALLETLGAEADQKDIDWFNGNERYEYFFIPEGDLTLTARLVTARPRVEFSHDYTYDPKNFTYNGDDYDYYFGHNYHYSSSSTLYHLSVNRIDIVRTFLTLEEDGTYTLTLPSLDKFDWILNDGFTFEGWKLSMPGGDNMPEDDTLYQPGKTFEGLTGEMFLSFRAVTGAKSAN